jgi:hypothetical protein
VLDIQTKAQDIASRIVEACTEITTMLMKALYGENIPTDDKALIMALSLELLAFALHLTDRFAYIYLDEEQRYSFMDALLPEIQELINSPYNPTLQELYNTRQEFYGGFDDIIPEIKESLKGNLFWEFGKALTYVYANSNPVATFQVSLIGIDMFKLIYDILLHDEVIQKN